MIAKSLVISLGFDTSENLSASQYNFLRSKGFAWGVRYVPLSGQSTTAPGIIQPAELANALAAKLGIMFVQFARGSGWTSNTGLADGKTAATYVRSLGVPSNVCLWADMGVTSTAQVSADYLNAWYEGAVSGGMDGGACGVYFEPGNPMTADQRDKMISQSRYWATGADDPARFPPPRGCQLIQLWASAKGEYEPESGLVIDADVAQADWLENWPVAVFGS
jgi:hypothetical protein